MYIILTDFILRTPHLFSFIWVSHKNLFKCTVYFTIIECCLHASSARLVHPDGQGTHPLQFQACLYELISKLTGNEDYKISKGHETDHVLLV